MVPPRPDNSHNGGTKKKGQESGLVERIDKLMQQLEEEREESRRQRHEHKEEMDKLLQQLLGKAAN